MKIAYVIDGMYNSGGMERVLSVCANALSAYHDITIITAFQGRRPDCFYLSPKIRRHDLGISEEMSGHPKKEIYKKRLFCYLKKDQFDIVVSLGGMELDFLHSFNDGSVKIVWFHFAIDIAETAWVGTKPNLPAKIKAKLRTWKRIYYARKYKRIVVISKADLNKWAKYTDNAVLIYNPLTIENPPRTDMSEKRVMSVGRLCHQKGFDFLINAWKLVAIKHKDWHLDIFGEGGLRSDLQNQIDSLNLGHCITLCGQSSDIARIYAKHSIFVMSSRAEGFGLVLVEAASCGLPLVAFDCPSGPSELVLNGKNGFLIDKVGDVLSMANAISTLIEDKELRKRMGMEAMVYSKQFNIENIISLWNDLFSPYIK